MYGYELNIDESQLPASATISQYFDKFIPKQPSDKMLRMPTEEEIDTYDIGMLYK